MTGAELAGQGSGRAVGIDLGERRIGLAVSDPSGVLVTPYGVLERSGDAEADRRAVARVVADLGADVVVVGLPLSLSGATGSAARRATTEARSLASVLGVPVETFDERLTTVEAARRRHERTDGTPGRRTGPRRRRAGASARTSIDAEAAAVMLEAWLATRAARRR